MPVIHVRALPQKVGMDVPATLKKLACAVAAATEVAPQRVFATWETLPPDWYAEGENTSKSQPAGTHPPIVTSTAFEGRSPATVRKMILAVVEVLGRELGIEQGNAFVTYCEARAGQIYTGGQIRER